MSARALSIALGAVASSAVLAPATAGATTGTFGEACTEENYIDIVSHHQDKKRVGKHWKDGPGGTMTATSQREYTLQATVGGSTNVSADALVAAGNVQISGSITGSATVRTGHQYSHDIDPGKYGHMQMTKTKYRVSWEKIHRRQNCTTYQIDSGTGQLPSSIGYEYWQTAS